MKGNELELWIASLTTCNFNTVQINRYPGYQRFFSRAAGIFGVGGSHYKDLTETGNRARKVSGTQGN